MWQAEFLDDRVVKEFFALPVDLQASYFHIVELIQKTSPREVGMPYIRSLGGKLWEIRMKGKDGIARAVYVTAKEKRLVIVHVFVKKTQATPDHAIKLAQKRIKEAGL